MTPHFGEAIRKRRRDLELTQEAVATAIHCATPYITLLEQGKRRPSTALVKRLAAALRMNERELFALANPEAGALFKPSPSGSSPWETWLADQPDLTETERRILEAVNELGRVAHPVAYSMILSTVRQAVQP